MLTEGGARPPRRRRRRQSARTARAAGPLLAAAAVVLAGVVGSAAGAAAAAAAAATPLSLIDRCILDGRASDPACAGARYPAERAEADVASLCRAMPDMSGCSLRRLCAAAAAASPSPSPSPSPPPPPPPHCAPFALLAALCEEMPTMRGCGAYVALCGRERGAPDPGPPAAQCRDHPPPKGLVGSGDARRLVRGACADMPMDGCALCPPTGGVEACPDPLRALSAVCLSMGGMSQCAAFDAMCKAGGGGGSSSGSSSNGGGAADAAADPVRALCGAGGGVQATSLPPMRMWFHQRVPEVLLWRTWVPRTAAAYAGCVAALLAFGVASVALKTARGRFEAQWIHDALCSRSPARLAAAAAAAQAQEEAARMAGAAEGGWAAAAQGAPGGGDNSGGSSSNGSGSGSGGRVATCCERHAALGPRSPLQRASQTLAFANGVRAALVGAAAVLDYFNMLAVMTFNAGFFAAVVCGYALGTLLLSHLVVPPPLQQQQRRRRRHRRQDAGGAKEAADCSASGAPGGRRRKGLAWFGVGGGGGGAGKGNGAAGWGGPAAAAAGATNGGAAAAAACCGSGVEARGQHQQPQRRSSDGEHVEEADGVVARHVATSAAGEACC